MPKEEMANGTSIQVRNDSKPCKILMLDFEEKSGAPRMKRPAHYIADWLEPAATAEISAATSAATTLGAAASTTTTAGAGFLGLGFIHSQRTSIHL
jgi:hypothetical protein